MKLPKYIQLKKFNVEILENMGSKVKPQWGSRFMAVVKTKIPLHAFDQKDKRNDITFVTVRSEQGTNTEVYGTIISSTYQGKWKHRIDIEGNPIGDLGKPLNQFKGKKVLARGSQEEKSYFSEVKRNEVVLYKGKMWQQSDDDKRRRWNEANKYCQNLELGGYDDWRLPTKDELKNLVVCSNGKKTPLQDDKTCIKYTKDGYRVVSRVFAKPTINTYIFRKEKGRYVYKYWTSTNIPNTKEFRYAYTVDFASGAATPGVYHAYFYTRCIKNNNQKQQVIRLN